MHTFFINTSKKDLTGYDVLFDIHYERKNVVSMTCLLSEWYDPEKGYTACARQMSEMIDGYVELNNAYNLIIYIDLPENKAYSAIKRDVFHDKERDECCRAMHILFTHAMGESIIADLVDSGRRPQNVLLMFGEEKKFVDFQVAEHDPSRRAIMGKLFGFLGLPGDDAVVSLAKEMKDIDRPETVEAFAQQVLAKCGEEIVPGIRERYASDLHFWFDEILHAADMETANENLFTRIQSIHRAESERIGIESLSCPYDCYACKVNKSVLAQSQLNIALHLLACAEANSIYQPANEDGEQHLIPFRRYKVEEVAPFLLEKRKVYAEKAEEVENLAKSYPELQLAPRLAAMDFERFGLDVYGDPAVELTERKTEPAAEEDAAEEEGTVIIRNGQELVIVEKGGKPLFTKDEFAPFSYRYDESEEQVRKNATPEEYVEQAKKVRLHHLDYLKKLKVHVSDVLSNYAGKSKANKPALLQVGGYRYARYGKESSMVEEEGVLESVETAAEKAYVSIMDQYMEFCAGRSVAVTDIEEQCNWFVSRIRQIQESLNRIRSVALGLLIGVLALYIPFFVLQFEAITESALTITVALLSVALPVLLAYAAFTVVAIAQKKKYKEAWDEFKEKSDEALAANALAAQKYDQLLSVVVPALRWVYEYKLDVAYCVECCSVADAKIEHHRRKLRTRVSAITNILGDLEYREPDVDEMPEEPVRTDPDAIDYNASFCAGKKNPAFYTVIDRSFFDENLH